MALTEKMKKFARAIVEGKSNKEAAILAGYAEKSASQQGSKLRNDPEIIIFIEKLKAEKEGRTLTSEKQKVKPTDSGEDCNPLDEEFPYTKDDPLQFLIDVMNNKDNEMFLRFNAAKAALPYTHGKVADKGKKETKAEAAKNAAKAGGKFATLQAQMKPS
ncbi:TPA: terminase small subunit [Acinetobacter baumannii]|uniref:terminase small subunit n=1 Tax=Acinetobacter calcoaceticus/baumannii complex TaxID=909768 RepID=UPI00021B7952|nr:MULTISPECIES: terminase small subunit [Acinetobacter calcoaceticus/baumannii complex]EXD21826.1 terminase small subunit [Acinetobacter baumannii 34654]KCW32443.1 terminase small subunit [Acinetobacter baumannii 6935]EGT99127.1 phage related protein [Acinetobacter baumannii ABNIH4]EIB7230179.1 terminase small subunit [Acinetobacter baumannii]EIB7254197.1 terminase small subunit [Acinetobacter baumannii]